MSEPATEFNQSLRINSRVILGIGLLAMGIILLGIVFFGAVYLNQYKFSTLYPIAVLIIGGASLVIFRYFNNRVVSIENQRTVVTLFVFLLTALTAMNLFSMVSEITPIIIWSIFTLCVVPIAVMIPYPVFQHYLPGIRPDLNVFLCGAFTGTVVYASFIEGNIFSNFGLLQMVINGGIVLAGSFTVYLFMSGVGFLSAAMKELVDRKG